MILDLQRYRRIKRDSHHFRQAMFGRSFLNMPPPPRPAVAKEASQLMQIALEKEMPQVTPDERNVHTAREVVDHRITEDGRGHLSNG